MSSPHGVVRGAVLATSLAVLAIMTLHAAERAKPSASISVPASASAQPPGPAPAGMVWISGGEFSMGSEGTSSYRFAQSKIAERDERIGQHLTQFEDRAVPDTPPSSLKSELHRICGVDLTKIPGIKEQAAQIIISESRLGHDPMEHRKAVQLFSRTLPE